MSAAVDVLAVIAEAGFTETGVIANPGIVGYAAGQAVGGRFSFRRKFRKGNIGCTVGKRTTCIYRIGDDGPMQFQNHRTSDVDAVRAALALIGEANAAGGQATQLQLEHAP